MMQAPEQEHVVIVGGGVMGLSCAAAISRAGRSVTLVDSSSADTVRSSRGDTRGLQFGYEGVYFGETKRRSTPKFLAFLYPCALA